MVNGHGCGLWNTHYVWTWKWNTHQWSLRSLIKSKIFRDGDKYRLTNISKTISHLTLISGRGSGYPPTMARCNSTTTRGYPPTMVRSNMVDVKTAQDNIKLTPENLLQSLATSLNSPEFSSAVATSLTNLQVFSFVPTIMT